MPKIGMLGELHAHQEAAVGAPFDAQAPRRGDLPGKQVLGHGGEVVIDDLSFDAQSGLVPLGAELTAPADICQDVGAAPFQP